MWYTFSNVVVVIKFAFVRSYEEMLMSLIFFGKLFQVYVMSSFTACWDSSQEGKLCNQCVCACYILYARNLSLAWQDGRHESGREKREREKWVKRAEQMKEREKKMEMWWGVMISLIVVCVRPSILDQVDHVIVPFTSVWHLFHACVFNK